MIYTSDYEMIDIALTNSREITFDDQWFYDFSTQLGHRNLTYSMLDQVIFGCHMFHSHEISKILTTFTQAKIINIFPRDSQARYLVDTIKNFKLRNQKISLDIAHDFPLQGYTPDLLQHERVLNIPFGFLFNRSSYDRYYADIRKFLGLKDPLICFEYVEFYLSKQNAVIQTQLQKYSQSI